MFASLFASLTSRSRNVLVVAVTVLAGVSAPLAAADTITVNGATRYQTMKGWEAHARSWQVDKLRNAYDPSWKVHAPAIAARMVNELGINRIQVPLRSGWQNPVDYWAQFVAGSLTYTEWKSHNYEKSGTGIQFSEFDFLIETSVLPMAAALAARGEKLYVNLGYGDFNTAGFLQGTLSFAANSAAYASFVQVFFDRLRTKYGITADALELLNEPENTAWNGTQIGQALVAAKAKLVAAGYVGLNYIGPSPSSAGNMQAMANAMLAVPGAAQALTTLSYHRYDSPGAGAIAALDTYAKAKGLQLDMSEWINATADTLLEDLTVGNVASWQKWAVADRKEAGRTNPQAFYYLCDISTSPPTITMAPNTTFMAQYFRYVRQGAVRIGAQSSVAARRPVAFQNANGSYVVVVKTNAGTGSQPVTFTGMPPGTYGVRTTNFSGLASDLADVVAAADGSVTTTIADGFTTIYGKGATAPPPPPPPPTTGSLSFTPTATFASQTVGTTSAAKTITVTNVGGAPVTVTAIVSSNASEFPIASSSCGMLNPGWDCTFNITFKPSAAGARAATITLTSNGAGSPQTLSASGTGLAAGTPPPAPGRLSFVATTAFANQTVGTTSAAKAITLTNTGGTAVSVTGIVSSNASEFPITGSACGTVNPGSACSFSLAFRPSAAGARAATITLTSNGVGSPQALSAGGTGLAPTPPPPPPTAQGKLSFVATSTFGNQTVGTTSAARTITITNIGSAAVTVQGIVSSNAAEFSIASSTCGTLNPGWDCTFNVTFRPAAAGTRTGTLTVASNGVSSPQSMSATGTGVAAATLGPLSFVAIATFGNQTVGTTSATRTIAITNSGSAPIAIRSVVSNNAAEFPVTYSSCGVLNPGAVCYFGITFRPSVTGARTGTVTVDGGGSPRTMSASGIGISGGPSPPPDTIDLVEFHHTAWNHFFLTGSVDEIAKLDAGTFAGWVRTGQQFKAFPAGGAIGTSVCRFFSTSFAPRSSHFYTSFASECAIVSGNRDWLLEAGDVFMIQSPAADGTCAVGTDPVYRMYNNGEGAAPNHRFTTDISARTQMMEQGWIPEGYGPAGVIMCAPQ